VILRVGKGGLQSRRSSTYIGAEYWVEGQERISPVPEFGQRSGGYP
jgi:hypothetical protein